mmetsp:Transcript_18166/g.45476  ORF Transcript_18166/g.45476 Transcript_18166/m.45476 type:complete len:252 (+) Transcript_18166:389-1144(+)|eukprot:CAMPEP_0179000864 /NCGR_PEP_ID=MMETSP0795-20121207/10959_1 /TAXON_ID=88552 /ORGANISM="Amoebophrya sp., Strain Ameob2" /LENGTH=251 /DNA_ID=CAMNT_0020694009 /DNA_START=317 /DNA_END=1072 /DNA_ORIENTATION=-
MSSSQPKSGASEASMMKLRSNLTGAKEARKRAELDAQLLANRIALLKQEEDKAWKKIDETRKRAGEIVGLRTVNESKFMAKEDFYKGKWEGIRHAQAQNAYNRDKAKATREQTKTEVMEQKKKSVDNVKGKSQQNLMAKKERQAMEQQINNERSEMIRRQKAEAKAKLEREQEAKLQKYREEYENRVAQEEMLRCRTEALVAQMEKEEMELIQRLQNTQTVQRRAYEELEGALGSTSQKVASPVAGEIKDA